MQKQIGFNGGGLWALIIGLGALVYWVRHDFGIQAAGWVMIGLFSVIVLLIGQLMNLAQVKSIMGNLVDYEQSQMQTRSQVMKGENMLLKASLGFARPMAKQMAQQTISAYRIADRQHQQGQADPVEEPDYWTVDAAFDQVEFR
jgi:hypothetical protein